MTLVKRYYRWRSGVIRGFRRCHPVVRQFIRFLALPYCYLYMMDWEACPRSRIRVARDFAYLFFVLRHFPDNYSMHRLWEVERDQWALYFGSIYDPAQRYAVDRELCPADNRVLSGDKAVWHLLATALKIPTPRCFGELSPDTDYRCRIRALLDMEGNLDVVIKPSCGGGGRGMVVARMINGAAMVGDSRERFVPLKEFTIDEHYIIEEAIVQHPEIAAFHPWSVNTIRYITIMTRTGEVHEIGAMMRMGVGGSSMDNRSQGGIAARIELDSGTLRGPALSVSHREFNAHPDTGIPIDGFRLPGWESIRQVAIDTQKKYTFSKLIGQDIAITPLGPVLLEINIHPDTQGLEQVCGPLFANRRTWEVFEQWGLLINQPGRRLYLPGTS